MSGQKNLVARYFLMALHFQNPYKYISFPYDIIVVQRHTYIHKQIDRGAFIENLTFLL